MEIFSVVKPFQSRRGTLCLPCFQKAKHLNNALLLWSGLILGIVSLPLTLCGPTHTIGYLLLNFFTFQFFALVATVIHELGHIVAARLVGFRAFGVEVGRGTVVYDFLFAGLRWQFRAIPYGGMAFEAARSTRFFRLRKSLIVLGGPLANFVALTLGIRYLRFDQFFETTALYGYEPMLVFALANVALLPFSLWPHTFKVGAREYANDALLLWRVLRASNANIAEGMWTRYWYETLGCQRKKDFIGAQRWADEGLRLFPKNISLKMVAATNLHLQRRYSDAARSFALLVGRNKQRKDLDTLFLNNIAYNTLLIGKSGLLARADTCSRLALQRAPGAVYYKGTRGSVLVELGHYEEGLRLLHDAMMNHTEKYAQALNACHIGIAEARRGNLTESRNYFSIARKLDPDCVLLARESGKN